MKPKRVFTKKQKNINRVFNKIKYIARDMDGSLWGFVNKPYKDGFYWKTEGFYCNLSNLISIDFPQITWEDEEPTSREEILGELKQIEEMAQAMSGFELEDTANCDIELSRHLIAKGYRKQSDTAKEILRMLKDKGLFRYESYLLHDSDFNTVAKLYGVDPEEV